MAGAKRLGEPRTWINTARNCRTAVFIELRRRVVDIDSASPALAVWATTTPAVLIAELAMPEVDGFALIRQVRLTHRGCPPSR